jgi:hypothetical protein
MSGQWHRNSTGKLLLCLIGLAVACVGMRLALNPQAEVLPSSSAEQSRVSSSSGGSTTALSAPYSGVEDLHEKVSADLEGPMDLKQAVNNWLDEEQKLIERLRGETYEQSLALMSDWGSSYSKLSLDVDPQPVLPESAKLIVHSRRFAKLMKDTAGVKWNAERDRTLKLLQADTVHWAKLYSEGQRPEGDFMLTKVGENSSNLIVPLMFRMNTSLLLIAQHPDPACLPAVVQHAKTLGDNYTNWAIAALAADRIMSAASPSGWTKDQLAALEHYRTWKRGSKPAEFTTYVVVDLPSYESPNRPYDRASSVGVKPSWGNPDDKISVVVPQLYKVYLLGTSPDARTFSDLNSGKAELAKRILNFSGQVVGDKAVKPVP